MKSDIEIARETPLKKIKDVAESINIPREEVLLYGRYMLYFDKIFDFEDKLHRINSMTYADAQEGLLAMFNEDYKAVAVVGNTDKAFDL